MHKIVKKKCCCTIIFESVINSCSWILKSNFTIYFCYATSNTVTLTKDLDTIPYCEQFKCIKSGVGTSGQAQIAEGRQCKLEQQQWRLSAKKN